MNISLVRFYMKNGDYESAVEFSERMQVQTQFCTGSELEAIFLVKYSFKTRPNICRSSLVDFRVEIQ